MRSGQALKVLLANNRPAGSGIGRYASSLHDALGYDTRLEVRLDNCGSKTVDQLFYRSIGKPLPYVMLAQAARMLELLQASLRFPKGYHIYHFLNPVIAGLSPFLGPRVVTVHDLISFQLKRSMSDYLIEKLSLSLNEADMIIAVSSFTARLLVQKLGINDRKISVIPHGVDSRIFRPRNRVRVRKLLGIPEKARIVLHVGSDEPRKNVDGLFRIFRYVKEEVPAAVLLRVGITSRTFPPADLSSSVRLLTVPEEQLCYYYNAADVFVFPSLMEGFGFPLLEAMASGTPVVTTTSASIPEVVGDSALTFEPSDEVSIAKSALSIIKDRDLVERLSSNSVQRASKFTWSECARRTAKVYFDVANLSRDS